MNHSLFGCIAVLILQAVLFDVEDDVGGDDREVWNAILIHFPARRDCGVLVFQGWKICVSTKPPLEPR